MSFEFVGQGGARNIAWRAIFPGLKKFGNAIRHWLGPCWDDTVRYAIIRMDTVDTGRYSTVKYRYSTGTSMHVPVPVLVRYIPGMIDNRSMHFNLFVVANSIGILSETDEARN